MEEEDGCDVVGEEDEERIDAESWESAVTVVVLDLACAASNEGVIWVGCCECR